MTFSADLVHFEQVLLDSLQMVGAGQVTLLLDHQTHSELLSDRMALEGPGVRYRIAPVYVGDSGCFHPKIYFTLNDEGARLWVASANLTVPGLRRNAEVVEFLEVSRTGAGDTHALRQFAAMLEDMVSLGLVTGSAEEELKELANYLQDTIGDAISPEGPSFLHSVREPLLPQIVGCISDARAVERIWIFSPYYDAGSRAAASFLDAFPDAEIHLVKSGERADDIDGPSLLSLGPRISLSSFRKLRDLRSRLHAKLYLLEGDGRAWTVAGSANLSAPALLRSVTDVRSGNFETVVVREVEPAIVASLKERVELRKESNLAAFNWNKVGDADRTRDRSSLPVIAAEARRDVAVLTVPSARWPGNVESLDVDFEQSGRFAHAASVSFEPEDPWVRVEARFPDLFQLSEAPVAVWLVVRTAGGDEHRGQAWLERPAFIARSAVDRSLSRTLKKLRTIRRGGEEDFEVLSETLMRAWALVQRSDTYDENVPSAGRDGPGEVPENPSDPTEDPAIPSEQLVADDTLLALSRSARRNASNEIAFVLDGFRNALDAIAEDSSSEATGEPLGASPGSPTYSALADEPHLRPKSLLKSAQKLSRSLQQPVPDTSETGDPKLFLELVAASSVVLLWAFLQAKERAGRMVDESEARQWAETATTLRRELLQVLGSTISISKLSLGQPSGWIFRFVHTEDDLFSNVALDSSRWSPGILLAAITGILGAHGEADESHPVPISSVVAGIHIALRRREDWRQTTAEISRHLIREFSLDISDRQVERLLERPALDSLPDVTAVRPWLLLHKLLHNELGPARDEALTELEDVYPNIYGLWLDIRDESHGEPAAIEHGNPAVCGYCRAALPTAWSQMIRRGEGLSCDMCGHILMPVDVEDPTVELVVDYFFEKSP